MTFVADLKASPQKLSASSRFTVYNGLFYFGTGALLMVWPGVVQFLFRDASFVGNEAALARVLGMTLAVIFGSTSSAAVPVAGRSSPPPCRIVFS